MTLDRTIVFSSSWVQKERYTRYLGDYRLVIYFDSRLSQVFKANSIRLLKDG
jgi:hypothetical protein